MLASGLSPWQADGTIELFEWIRHGATAAVREVTGVQPHQPIGGARHQDQAVSD
jgi:hypothetical protein